MSAPLYAIICQNHYMHPSIYRVSRAICTPPCMESYVHHILYTLIIHEHRHVQPQIAIYNRIYIARKAVRRAPPQRGGGAFMCKEITIYNCIHIITGHFARTAMRPPAAVAGTRACGRARRAREAGARARRGAGPDVGPCGHAGLG